jgi:hypothetical protein
MLPFLGLVAVSNQQAAFCHVWWDTGFEHGTPAARAL